MNKIIFIHIPKTAGATFREILRKNFKKSRTFMIHDMFPEESLKYLHTLSQSHFEKFDLIAGHGAHYLLNKANTFESIIFLRDPVKQILSTFYHIKRSKHSQLHNDLKKIVSLHGYYDYLKKIMDSITRLFTSLEQKKISNPEKGSSNSIKMIS